jgi:hypothetical protein
MLIVLEAFVTNPPRGMGRRFAQMKREALREVAWYWHSNLLARHFTPGNSSRYRMKTRTAFYRRVIKPVAGEGQGRFVDLQLKGRSLRWMRAFATVSGNAYSSTLRMRPPGYFTRPFIGSFTDRATGRRKTITQQPDKPAEVRQVSTQDRADMVRFIQRGVVRGFRTGRMPSGRASTI